MMSYKTRARKRYIRKHVKQQRAAKRRLDRFLRPLRDPAAVGLMGPPGPEAADNRKVSAAGVDLRDERPVDVLRSCRSGIPAQPLHCPERPQGWRYGRCHSAGDVSWSLCGLT